MIKIIIELDLIFPYNLSMETLLEFCYLWDSHIISAGTKKLKSIISMPDRHFKKIFGTDPKIRKYPVPSGMEKFISKFTVKKIET